MTSLASVPRLLQSTAARVDLPTAARLLDRSLSAPEPAEVAWSAPADRYSFRAFTGPTGNVVEAGNVRTFAVHAPDGHVLNQVTAPPGVAEVDPAFRPDGGFYLVYVTGGEQNQDLLGVDGQGRLLFRLEKAGVEALRPTPGGGVAVKGREGVFGVAPDGKVRWRFETDEPLSYLGAPSVSGDGTVHLCGKEKLYALEVPSADADPLDTLVESAGPDGPAPQVSEGDGWVLIGGIRLEQAR